MGEAWRLSPALPWYSLIRKITMIDFEIPEKIAGIRNVLETVAVNMMRPVSRYYDENEHEIPWDYINFMHTATKAMGGTSMGGNNGKQEGLRFTFQRLAVMVEMLSWGDAGIYLTTPGGMLGSAAVISTGTPEQKERFLKHFQNEKPVFDAMCMTEPGCGSDTSAIRTRAVLDKEKNEWVLNGEKIFVTAGHKALVDSDGFIVVWATVDPAAGRAGMHPFVVEAGTPGVEVARMERKMGIRASDTVAIVLQDCRIPYENILGNPEIVTEKSNTSFKGAMATFDATRPIVAAQAIGVARATLELLQQMLAERGVTIRFGLPRQKLTSIEKDVIDMEIQLRSAWWLVLKAVWMMDNGKPNSLESSMAKVRAGDVVNKITQRAVEIMGPLGYSCDYLLEKWFRDAKISDIYEGTGQINRLVVARQILGYHSSELR
jgi:acyl-CoA dehydrogenase